jgi:soluble lytic murein transglycosylase
VVRPLLVGLLALWVGPGSFATARTLPRPVEKAAEKADPPPRPVPFDRRWIEPYFASGDGRAAAEKFRRDDFRAAVAGFTRVAKRAGARGAERLPARYMTAMAEMELENWAAAGEIFEDLHTRYPVLAPYPAYHAARCRLRRGDSEGALIWAQKVPEGTVLEAEAILIRLDALAALGKFAEVERESAAFLDRFPNGPRRAEAMFQRGQAMERLDRPVAEVAAVYRKIWSEAPLEAWARRAEDRLSDLGKQQAAVRPASAKLAPPPTGGDLTRPTADEWLTRAMILFDRNQNEAAEAAFGSTLSVAATTQPGGGDPELRCKAEFHRAQSVFKQRERTRAVPLFAQAQAACKQAGDKDLFIKSLYQGARSLNMAGKKDEALKLYAALEQEGPEHSYADDARLRAAEIHRDEERLTEAAAMLAEVPQRYPNGDQLGEALWRLALQAIREQKWPEAHKWLDENLKRIPREDIWYAEGRALYWKGRVYAQQGMRKEAQEFYTRAVKEYPLSVYAFLGLERLRESAPEARRALVARLRAGLRPPGQTGGPADLKTWQFKPRPVFGTPEWKRAVELARLGFGSDARRELARLGFSAPESRDAARKAGDPDDERQDVYWITAVLLDRGRSWAAAHAIPRYTLTEYRAQYPAGREAAEWRLAFPRAFPEFVVPQSKSNRVPEALQWAIMREESAFNPRIESIANALGLTQMLVKTARRFSERSVSRDTLLDPGKNVELGSKYLSFLLDRYSGMPPLTIASYNAGEGAVDRWLRDNGEMQLDEFLETIDYDETRNYTKRVLSSFLTYAWLYNDERPVPELRFSLKPPRPDHVGRPAGRSPKSRRPR